MVPAECLDIGNSTAVIQKATGDWWTQPGSYSYRICTVGEPLSDVCDPGPEQIRSNTLSFLVVFFAQIAALLLSKFILAWKMRKMIDKYDQQRKRGLFRVLDASIRIQVEAFTKREAALPRAQVQGGSGLTVKQRVRRGIRAMMFARRLRVAVESRQSVDELTLEVAEAVAAHWVEVRGYYCTIVIGALKYVFFVLGAISTAKATLE